MRNRELLITGVAGLVGVIALSWLANKFSFKQILTQRDVINIGQENNQQEVIVRMSTYKDLTTKITPKTLVFPGDPIFVKDTVVSIDKGNCFNLCKIQMGNHMGTHVDFPAHVLKGGKTSSDYSLDDLIGNGLIIEVPVKVNSINKKFVEEQNILENDFVFFKTKNSNLSKQDGFKEKYVYIEPDAAKELLNKKVKVIGIDYISVDSYDAEELPVHKILLSNGVLIVENLELKGVDPGRCKLFIMPLNIPDMDGLPARVAMSGR